MEQTFRSVRLTPVKKSHDTGMIAVIICAAVILALLAGLVLSLLAGVRGRARNPYAAVTEAAGIIEDEFYFLEGIDGNTLAQSAIWGMLEALDDPYAAYYTEEEYNEMLRSNAGDYQGIGISVLPPDETGSMILTVYPDSPMEEAGALAGDIILSVNGTSAAGMQMDDFLALFSEEDGGTDTLILLRGETQFTVQATRREVHVARIFSEILDGGIGYIRIEQFTGTVVTEFKAAVQEALAHGVSALVIDLRDNPGGGLTEVLGVASYLLPKGELICTLKSRHGAEKAYRAEGEERLTDMPIALLVNGNSASASELLSGALQDHGVATVIGTQTFGKGIVQSYYRLKDGAGWVKLTTDAYYTPHDVCIQGAGITPDYVIELAENWTEKAIGAIPHEEDAQLIAALDILDNILRKAAA